MCAKNHLLIFSSFLDIWENVEWPHFFLDHPVYNFIIFLSHLVDNDMNYEHFPFECDLRNLAPA